MAESTEQQVAQLKEEEKEEEKETELTEEGKQELKEEGKEPKKTATQIKKEKRFQERREKYKQRMVERRKRKKENKKKEREENLNVNNTTVNNTSNETTQENGGKAETQGEWIKKPNFLRHKKLMAKAKCKSGQKIAIDLGFGDLMNDSELASVLNQIKHAYGKNLTVANPFHMHLVSINTPEMANRLNKMQGYENWEVEKEERGYLDLFPASDIVYLSPDSPNILTELDFTKVYVIGGLSDYNRAKNTSLDKANHDGVATAKLPLHLLNMHPSVVPILCIDHVFLTLLYYSISKDWIDAMYKALPARKTRTAHPQVADNSASKNSDENLNADVSALKIS